MNQTKRVHSIARKIGNSWLLRSLSMLIALNIALAVLFCCYTAYDYEKRALASDWTPELKREFIWVPAWKLSSLPDAEYRFESPDGRQHVVAVGTVLSTALPFAGALGVIELIILISEGSKVRRRARRLLRPLNKIAQEMQAFSDTQSDGARYEDRLHDLESAIEAISPTHPDAKLRTGTQELNGLENAINDLLVRMHESYRQQAQFVSDASHELRTPIAVIQGYAHMLSRWGKDDAQVLEESISAIQSESDYMKKLVEELLFLARGEIGRNPYEPELLSLTEMLHDVCDESAMIDSAHQWQFQSGGEISVTADAAMLKQCARILCENARKYTPEGGQILLHAWENDGQVCFSVQDEGIGIASEDVKHIFDRFYRSDPARDRNSGGSGLGLSIAKWIIERHGGFLSVLSREGVGTRFTVTLPKNTEKAA